MRAMVYRVTAWYKTGWKQQWYIMYTKIVFYTDNLAWLKPIEYIQIPQDAGRSCNLILNEWIQDGCGGCAWAMDEVSGT